ncbi:MAG: class I SAM-dependent methyltransferase, partial [Ruminococcus sp.]|nr:class I SAM-dependent methyltransferase [Ruminococcus sp.]
NFGWLPKGDHNISTKAETSIAAIEKGLRLLKPDGFMTLIIYYGRETGFEERDAILSYLPTIDPREFTVVEMPFVNRQNCPPIPIVIFKGM